METTRDEAPTVQKSQPGVEELDRALSDANKLGQRWKERLTLDDPRLNERYLKGEIELLLRLKPRGHLNSVEFCAIFDRKGQFSHACDGASHRRRIAPIAEEFSHIEAVGGIAVPYEYRKSVFVADVDHAEFPESLVPSRVRLDVFDNAHDLCSGTLYFGANKGFVFLRSPHGIGVIRDGESGSADRPGFLRQFLVDSQPIDPLSGLIIRVGIDTIHFCVDEGFDRRMKIADLLFGPFDFSR